MCSDGTALPTMGDTHGYMRMLSIINDTVAKELTYTTAPETYGPNSAADVTLAEFMGVRNPYVGRADASQKQTVSCNGIYSRITGVDALVQYDAQEETLRDIQVGVRVEMAEQYKIKLKPW